MGVFCPSVGLSLCLKFSFETNNLAAYEHFCRNSDSENSSLEIKACDLDPCFNGGHCTNEPRRKYSCQCQSGWYGERCETSKLKLALWVFQRRI